MSISASLASSGDPLQIDLMSEISKWNHCNTRPTDLRFAVSFEKLLSSALIRLGHFKSDFGFLTLNMGRKHQGLDDSMERVLLPPTPLRSNPGQIAHAFDSFTHKRTITGVCHVISGHQWTARRPHILCSICFHSFGAL